MEQLENNKTIKLIVDSEKNFTALWQQQNSNNAESTVKSKYDRGCGVILHVGLSQRQQAGRT